MNISNLPAPRVPLLDLQTGLVTREWYRWFNNIFTLTGGGASDLTTAELEALIEAQPQSAAQTEQITELQKQVQGLEELPPLPLGTMGMLQQNSVPHFTMDTTPDGIPSSTPGTVYWDKADGNQTLSVVMANGTTTMQVGEETFFRVKASAAITDGQVVMFTGTVGASGAVTAAPATGLTPATALYVMGVATESIALNSWGYITCFGVVRGVDTSGGAEAWVDGQILYLNPATTGGLTKVVPTAPNPKVVVAAVVKAHASAGSLFVRPAYGGRFGDFEGDVSITSVADKHTVVYNGANARWQNATPTEARAAIIGAGAGTPGNGGMLIGNGTDFTTALLTAGVGIAVSNGAGSVTVSNAIYAGAHIAITVNPDGTMGISTVGATGTFTTVDLKTVTVVDGIITNITL